jgi:hypothetical protein
LLHSASPFARTSCSEQHMLHDVGSAIAKFQSRGNLGSLSSPRLCADPATQSWCGVVWRSVV